MVRTDPGAAGKWYNFYRRPRHEREYLRTVANPDLEERMSAFRERTVWPERGLKVHEIPNQRVAEIADEHGWMDYVQTPEPYDRQLVLEFYASINPPVLNDYDTVVVRGTTVRLTLDDICNHYNVPRPMNLGQHYGISPINGVGENDTHSAIIASSLRRNGRGEWIPKEIEIKKSELHLDLAIWMMFLKTSLIPSSHSNTVDSYCARILYCLQHDLPLDIGHIIQLEIIDAAAPRCSGVLPFPCLITKLCRDAGVRIGPTIPPPPPFDRHTYQVQLSAARNLDRREALENEAMNIPSDADDDDADYQEDEDDERPRNMPRDIEGLTQHFDSRFNSLQRELRSVRTEIRSGFADLRSLITGQPIPDEAGPSNRQRERRVRRRPGGPSSSGR